jgi:uncharacterized protein (TIGR02453 family)
MQNFTGLSFNGYSKTGINFLNDLSHNNNRDWFNEHKHLYENDLKAPSLSLINEMATRFASLGLPYIADSSVSMFRIYRDIRFSKNKDPYKTNIGLLFPYAPVKVDARPVMHPCLYFHLSNEETFIAGGIHMPSPQDLRLIRQHISDNYDEFLDIISDSEFKDEFGSVLMDNTLAKVPKGFTPDNPAAQYLRLKEYTVVKDLNYGNIMDSVLPSLLEHSAVIIEPLLGFLFSAMYGV